MIPSHRSFALAVALVAATARPSLADESARPAANALFEEGRRLIAAGEIEDACARFEASLSLLPRLGVRLNLADCLERAGRTASAWALLTEAVHEAHQLGDPREAYARERLAALEPRLSRLAIDVSSSADLAGLEVRRDDVVLPPAMYGIELPVDAGPHTVVVAAPGHRPWSTQVSGIAVGGTLRLRVPALERSPALPSLATTGTPTAEIAVPGPRPAPARRASVLTWTALGVGAASCAVGAFTATRAWLTWRDVEGICGDGGCPPADHDRAMDARRDGTIATVAFTVGGVALATGAALYLIRDREPVERERTVRIAPVASTDGLTFVLDGRF